MVMMSELGFKLQRLGPSTRPFSLAGSEERASLDACLSGLEEERRKIEGFKRELPMCMQLISEAIQALREQQETASSLLKLGYDCDKGRTFEDVVPSDELDSDKPSWMAKAQLWSQESPKQTTVDRPQPQRMFLKQGAFSPFVKTSLVTTEDRAVSTSVCSEAPSPSAPAGDTATSNGATASVNKLPVTLHEAGNNNNNNSNSNSSNRKARRSWSPELHRRFLGALEQLGGSHAATPKQIREIMKVDGLTNDEVKSHLQKYRLHTRRPAQGGRHESQGLVVLGGIWVPTEFATAASVQQSSLCTVPEFLSSLEQQRKQSNNNSGSETENLDSDGDKPVRRMEEEVMDDGGDGDVTETEDSRENKAEAEQHNHQLVENSSI